MSGLITFLKSLAASIPTPGTGKVSLFVDSASGEPSYKDDTGTVTSLVGPTGPGVPVGGTTGQVLEKIDGTDYNTQWATPSSGFANPMTTAGDIITATTGGAAQRLAVGTNGYVLTVVGGVPAWAAASGGAYTGTTNRITITGTVIDISTAYVGQASITTLGTIATGVWNGTAVGAVYGGTGQSSYATGDILFASATNTLSKLAAGTNGYVLTLAGGVPTWAAGGGGGGLTNWTEAVNTSTPNATVPVVSFTATNAATNVDAAILAKGNGATLAQIPDNTTAGGVKRGQYAVDWQKTRTSAGNVASGNYSTIGGGNDNIANSLYSTVAGGNANSATTSSATVGGGSSNTASGSTATVGGGASNVASGSYATIPGGQSNTASQTYAFATGRSCVADADNAFASGQYAQCRGIKGAFARSQNFLASAGDAGYRDFMLAVSTTDATPTTITTNAAAAATNNQVVLANNSAVQVHGRILGRSSTGDVASFEVDVTLFRGASAATTVVVGTATSTQLAATAGASAWAVTLTANTTTGCLKIEVTGAASTSIKWSGWLRSADMY